MKPIFIYVVFGLALSGCNYSSNQASSLKEKPVTATAPIEYPYQIAQADFWEMGNPENARIVLLANKALENRNVEEALKYFSDSVDIFLGGLAKRFPKDSLRPVLTKATTYLKDNTIQMIDWISVRAKDKSQECVTLWFLNYVPLPEGGKDSTMMIQDLELKNGKIAMMAEYKRT